MTDREKQWEQVQIKGFTAWLNSYLDASIKVADLQKDLANGVVLCTFCESLKQRTESLKNAKFPAWIKKPGTKFQAIENLNHALKFFKDELKVKLVSIGAEDIYDGNMRLILGTLWSVFRKLRDSLLLDGGESGGAKEEEKALLEWVRKMTSGYRDVEIKGFKDSWHDGMALCALVHKFDESLIDYDHLTKENKEANLKLAFEKAEKSLGIPQLLEAEDLMNQNPDERSVIFYISLFFHAFSANEDKRKLMAEKKTSENMTMDLKAQLEAERKAKEELQRKIKDLENELSEKAKMQKELDELRNKLRMTELLSQEDKGLLEEKIHALQELLEENKEDSESHMMQLKMELEQAYKAREELEKLKKQFEHEGSDLAKQLKDAEDARNKLRMELEELKRKVQSEVERRKKKAKAALELEKENERLRRQAVVQGKARVGLEVLKRNLEEHLEDMYKWRELHQLDVDVNEKEVFNLDKVLAELQKKGFEEQLDVLNGKLQGENRNLQKILRLQDTQRELKEIVEKQGFLEIKGLGKSKEWKKQWFVLRGNSLFFYKSEDSDRQAGVIPLAESELQSVKADDDRKFVLGLKYQENNVVLSAKDKKELDAWRAVINGEITHNKYLSSLEKSQNKRPDTRLINVLKSSSVPSVYLDGHELHNEEIDALARTLTVHKDLDTISLTQAAIGDGEAKLLAGHLEKLSVRVLKLGDNKISSAGAAALAKTILANKDLVEVHLNGNKIDDAGAEALAGVFGGDSKLAVLNLTNNEIGDKGAKALATALEKSATIKTLDLADNNIGDAGAAAIAGLISKKTNLKKIQLEKNNIGDEGAIALAKALGSSDVVSEVDLSENNVGNKGALAFRDAFASSKGLNSANLSRNKVTGGSEIQSILAEGFTFPNLSFSRSAPH